MTSVVEKSVKSNVYSDIVNTFHDREPKSKKQRFEVALIGDTTLAMPLDERRHDSMLRDRLVYSHIKAQSDVIAKFVAPPAVPGGQPQPKQFLNFINIFDDASMWVARPPGQHPASLDALIGAMDNRLAAAKLKKRKSGGRMTHAPVLNLSEHIFKAVFHVGAAMPETRGLQVHSPAQVLPKANFSTVMARWRQWSVMNGMEAPGRHVDVDGAIRLALNQLPRSWANLWMVSDCLQLNGNIVCEVQAYAQHLRDSVAADRALSIFHAHCLRHSSVLAMKPQIQQLPGLSSHIVRFGHICQSARVAEKLAKSLDVVFQDKFRWRPCIDSPVGYDAWQLRKKQILSMTSVGEATMPVELREQIMYFDNGDWNEELVTHWCFPSCRCGRTEATARQMTRSAVFASAYPSCPLALEYRWKAMEAVNATMYRGRAQHNLAFLMVSHVHDEKAYRKAEQELAAAADTDLLGARSTVKLGLVHNYMKAAPAACHISKPPPSKHHYSVFWMRSSRSRNMSANSQMPQLCLAFRTAWKR